MTDEEYEQLRALLVKFAEEDMDQWASYRIMGNHFEIFVDITMEPLGQKERYIEWKPP